MGGTWGKWFGELPVLCGHLIPQTYFSREVEGSSMQLHGFCNASESAYAGVVHLTAWSQWLAGSNWLDPFGSKAQCEHRPIRSELDQHTVVVWIHAAQYRVHKTRQATCKGKLKTDELISAEEHWIASAQQTAYPEKLSNLRVGKELRNKQFLPLRPFIDSRNLLRIGGRIGLSQQPYERSSFDEINHSW